MGKVKFTAAVAEIRNKVGGVVYSRNRYGSYVRDYAIPTNPETEYQQYYRESFGDHATDWQAMSDEERKQWALAAQQVKKSDIYGSQYSSAGYQYFMQVSQQLYIIGLSFSSTPPILDQIPLFSGLTVDFDPDNGDFIFDLSQTELTEDQAIVIRATAPLSQGINYFKNKYAIISVIGDGTGLPYNAFTDYTDRLGGFVNGTRVGYELYVVSRSSGLRSRALNGYVDVTTSFNPYALAYFSECPTQPSNIVKGYYSTLFDSLQAGSDNLSKLRRLWVLCSEYEDNWPISLVNPTSTPASAVGSPTWTQYEGVTYAANKYINWNFNPFAEGLDSAGAAMGVYYLNDTDGFYLDFSNNDGSGKLCYIDSREAGRFYAAFGSTDYKDVANSSSLALMSICRIGTNIQIWNRDTKLLDTASTFTGFANFSLYGGARNSSGTTTNANSNRRIAFAFIGDDVDIAELYDSLQAFAVSVGCDV